MGVIMTAERNPDMQTKSIRKFLFGPTGVVNVGEVCTCEGGIETFRPLAIQGWGAVPFSRHQWYTLVVEGESGFACTVFKLSEPVMSLSFCEKEGADNWELLNSIAKGMWGGTWKQKVPPAPWLGILLIPAYFEVANTRADSMALRGFAEIMAKTCLSLSPEERGKVPKGVWEFGEFAVNPLRTSTRAACC